MKQRYRYRIYPTKAQEQMLARTFGCCRVVYNDYVELRRRERLSHGKARRRVVTEAKRTPERAWLADVSSVALNEATRRAETAYLRWFRGQSRPPRFHTKRARQSFQLQRNAFSFHGNKLYLAKVGDLKVRWSRALPSIPSSVTIVKEADGRYYASFTVERELEPWPTVPHSCGVDLGLTNFATVVGSDGTTLVFENPRFLRTAERRLVRTQRSLSRKQKGSRNRAKARVRLAVAHRKVRNKRLDQHHKVAHWLIRENQAVAVEDLNIAGMGKSRLAKSIYDAGWSQFLRILNEKAELHCRQVVKVDRWLPSTRACSSCGANEGASWG